MNIIKIKTSDQQVIEVTEKVARLSRTIDTMLNHLKGDSEDDAGDGDFVPLANIDGATLNLVIEWAEEHQNDRLINQTDGDDAPDGDDAAAELNSDDAKALATWDADFFARLPEGSLFGLIEAANFLDIPRLFALACKEAASKLSGMSIEEIRTAFGIVDDLSEEKAAQIREENAYFEV